MTILNSKNALISAGAAASMAAFYSAVPPIADTVEPLIAMAPFAKTAFGMALPAAAFVAASAAGPLVRACQRFRAAPPAEGEPKPYQMGAWGHSRIEKTDVAIEPAQDKTDFEADAELVSIFATIKNPNVVIDQLKDWIKGKSNITDIDFFYLMDHMPRGVGWGKENNALADLHSDMARNGMTSWNNKGWQPLDIAIVHAAIKKIQHVEKPEDVDNIYLRVQKFLPTSCNWGTYIEHYRAQMLSYFYKETLRLKKIAGVD